MDFSSHSLEVDWHSQPILLWLLQWVCSVPHFGFNLHLPNDSEKELATHSSALAWRIPGMGEPGGLPSMGSHRVGHDWSDLAAAAAAMTQNVDHLFLRVFIIHAYFSVESISSKICPLLFCFLIWVLRGHPIFWIEVLYQLYDLQQSFNFHICFPKSRWMFLTCKIKTKTYRYKVTWKIRNQCREKNNFVKIL